MGTFRYGNLWYLEYPKESSSGIWHHTAKRHQRQLYKLPDIVSVAELSNEETVNRELLLIKIKNSSETREDVRSASDAYEGKVVDYTKDSIMIQMIGDSRKIDNFVHLMKEFGILEICRTGIVSLQRGATTIRRVTNL